LGLSETEVETTYENSRGRCTALYTFLPDGLNYIDGAMLAAASDEAEFTIETNSIHKFNTGAWNAVSNPDADSWRRNFEGIYAANLFLAHSDNINLDYLKYDPNKQATYTAYLANVQRWKYEARFLRAYYYSELIKRYGGVPLLTEPIGITDDYVLQRDSLAKCVRFIVSECDSAAANLPIKYDNPLDPIDPGEVGKATKASALALKTRVLLFAASDLYNDPSWAGGYEHPEYISMADGKDRITRWQEAAAAGAETIRAMTGYWYIHSATSGGYADLFNGYASHSIYENTEILFARRYDKSNGFEKRSYPIGYNGATGGMTPLGNLVDDYQMKDGTKFNWNNPAHAANPYNNRDPRLEATVLTNNVKFAGGPVREGETAREVQIWQGGLDGKGVPRATKTGYYLRKYVNANLDLQRSETSMRVWMIMRVAEVFLNFAEAANEGYGPNVNVPGTSGTLRTAVQACNRVRTRVTMPSVPTSISYDNMKDIIRYERQAEFAFEDIRLWDVRRWMTAPETLGTPAKAVNVIKNEDGSFTYTPFELEKRVWENKMYFYPIPQRDLVIGQWTQNPLW
jgi:hypothetical protein